ncbi:MAG: hypothetical protein F9K24_13000 [Leptonema illini]|uniref:Uncharacterized protein n=1 Tax=Leptonema illini TaxID=183 RepID=A0A833H027_9LEPT|nr:MAG: hypothetical protein F9K24_13000 [Leptonema illini]
MKIEADGFSFNFTDALDAFVFDEKDKSMPHYHGQPMKAVDIIAEFADAYVFIEVKEFHDMELYDVATAINEGAEKEKRDSFRWLKNYLKYKYRDTYLFRHAEDKVDKPIHYICLLSFENPLNVAMKKALKQELPVGIASKRWKRAIVESCHVLNLQEWNKNFPKWPASKIAS